MYFAENPLKTGNLRQKAHFPPSLRADHQRMAKILLIETATEVCSAAIAVNGEIVAIAEEQHTLRHAELLTLQIDACVKESGIPLIGIDAVAVSRGPGSYTSLRVGASIAKGICYSLGKPLIAVDTLLSLAWAAREIMLPTGIHASSALYIPMLDARRQEVWTAIYDDTLRQVTEAQPIIITNNLFNNYIEPASHKAQTVSFVFSGNGSLKLMNETFSERAVFSAVKFCSTRHLARLSEQYFQNTDFEDIAYFEPVYMKPPNITTPGKAPF